MPTASQARVQASSSATVTGKARSPSAVGYTTTRAPTRWPRGSDPEVRVRLIKFYAMFKIVEMLRYERFRGFPA